MPVPPHLHLSCEGCGRDLAGAPRRVCPDCGRKFYIPLPEELDLTCPNCSYSLTGLTTRICPECGAGFDLRKIMKRPPRSWIPRPFNLSDQEKWMTGLLLAALGMLLLWRHASQWVCLLLAVTPIVLVRLYLLFRALDWIYPSERPWPRIVLWIGASWALAGVVELLMG
jgi:hypothetical protein